jgi:hypothetical protein
MVDLGVFYRNISSQLRYEMMYSNTGGYLYYADNDVSEDRGLTLRLDFFGLKRISGTVSYTLSDALTTGSDKSSNVGLMGTGHPIPDELFPATFNQRHRGIVDVDYRFGKDDGGPILEQLGLNILFRFNSGFSYTRVWSATNDYTDPRNVAPIEEIGASTTPWYFRLDARLDKSIDFGPVKTTFYVYVQNVFNRQNGLSVKPRTSDVYNDGWLASSGGRALLSQLGPAAAQYSQMYTYLNSSIGSADLDLPRTVRFGIRLEY